MSSPEAANSFPGQIHGADRFRDKVGDLYAKVDASLCVNMSETTASRFIRVEGEGGES